jgi:uncharacterized membrane protein (DUF485 family)
MESTTAGSTRRPDLDWTAVARSTDFRELTRKRRSFVLPATAFFVAWYFGFIILAGYAPDFMGERIWEGLTVGYLFALSQFVMVWVLAGMYLRRSNRTLDPIRERVRRNAGVQQADAPASQRRFRSGGNGRSGNGRSGNGRSGNGGGSR